MKMKRMILPVILILILAVILSGCKKPNFGINVNADNTASIEAVRASKGSFGGAGSLEVGEGQKIVVESKLNGKSEVSISFTGDVPMKADAELTELTEAMKGENAALEITVKGTGTTEYDLEPGVYFLAAKAIEKSNGTVLISVR